MLQICPQLGVRFLVDSNGWNVNGTPNPRAVKHMLRVLSRLVSDSVLAQPTFFQLAYFEPTFKHQIFYVQIYANMVEVPTAIENL